MSEQYFSAAPASQDARRMLHVTLRGFEAAMETSNGVFSGSRLDLGTSVLLRHAPELPEHGTFLDLGCGWGPVAVAMAQESPEADVWAVDVNERALDLTAGNARRNGCGRVHVVQTDESGAPLLDQQVPGAEPMPEGTTFDAIWSNPPIRIGKEALHELLETWLPRLAPGGRADLVVSKNLGADSLQKWIAGMLGDGYSVTRTGSSKGFRVLTIERD